MTLLIILKNLIVYLITILKLDILKYFYKNLKKTYFFNVKSQFTLAKVEVEYVEEKGDSVLIMFDVNKNKLIIIIFYYFELLYYDQFYAT